MRVISVPPVCTHTPLYLIYPPTYPTGLNKSVPQMTLLMPLAEIPLFYPRTCGSKAERGGEKAYSGRAKAEEKKNSLFDQKNTSPFMYWQRWKAHGDGGSLAGRIKASSVDDFTIWFFGNREYLYGMRTHLKIQTKSIFKRFYGCFVAAMEYF